MQIAIYQNYGIMFKLLINPINNRNNNIIKYSRNNNMSCLLLVNEVFAEWKPVNNVEDKEQDRHHHEEKPRRKKYERDCLIENLKYQLLRRTDTIQGQKRRNFLPHCYHAYERIRQRPVTDISVWPLVNESSRNKKPDSL